MNEQTRERCEEDWDDQDDCERSAEEEAADNCGADGKGFCSKIGSEECDFECPLRGMMLDGEDE